MAKNENETPEPRMQRDRDQERSDDRAGAGREFSNREWEQANAPSSREERRAFRERWSQTHLPNLPKKDGKHRCWVSTSHPTDTVARRVALGYRVLTLDDVKGSSWSPEASSVKDAASVDNTVRWREMVGMECSEELYQQYMREFHHDQPADMERDIVGQAEAAGEQIRDSGGRIEMGDGWKQMAQHRRAPKQFE